MADEFELDFGDETLNDPNYEANVEAADSVTPDGTTPAETTPQQGSEEGAAPKEQQAEPAGTPTGEGGATDAGGQPQQQQAGGTAPPGNKVDAKGNVVDAQGNIVAKAGFERRQFERTVRQESHIKRLEGDLAKAQQSDAFARALNEVPQKLGLDQRETEMGLQAIASFKKDPVATARWMLEETMRLGYNLQQIVGSDAQGQINGGTLDLAAIKSMIAEQVQPLVGDRNAEQQRQQADDAATREYEGFLAKHENAELHQDVLANMMQQDRTRTAEVAYWQLREYCAKNGYDFNKPLRDQAATRQQGAGGQPPSNTQQSGHAPAAQSHTAMPNGTAPNAGMQTEETFASPDDAWDVIVKQSLADVGML